MMEIWTVRCSMGTLTNGGLMLKEIIKIAAPPMVMLIAMYLLVC